MIPHRNMLVHLYLYQINHVDAQGKGVNP
jgi:hypothetical protein